MVSQASYPVCLCTMLHYDTCSKMQMEPAAWWSRCWKPNKVTGTRMRADPSAHWHDSKSLLNVNSVGVSKLSKWARREPSRTPARMPQNVCIWVFLRENSQLRRRTKIIGLHRLRVEMVLCNTAMWVSIQSQSKLLSKALIRFHFGYTHTSFFASGGIQTYDTCHIQKPWCWRGWTTCHLTC